MKKICIVMFLLILTSDMIKAKYKLKKPRTIKALYEFVVSNIFFKRVYLNKKFQVWISIPQAHITQKEVKLIRCIPSPTKKYFDKDYQNHIFYWNLINSKITNHMIKIKIYFELTSFEFNNLINEEVEFNRLLDKNTFSKYLKSETFINTTNKKIKQICNKIIKGFDNNYKKANIIFNWLVKNMNYSYNISPRKTLEEVLLKKKGDCGDLSALFVSLCRSAGIPARIISGYWSVKNKEGPHIWAEFFVPEIGWLPVDISVAIILKKGNKFFSENYKIPHNFKFYFGNLDNKRCIFSIGSDIYLEPYVSHTIPPILYKSRIRFLQPVAIILNGVRKEPEITSKLMILKQ